MGAAFGRNDFQSASRGPSLQGCRSHGDDLDFTHSLRVACSFATLDADGDRMLSLCAGIREEVGTEVEAGQVGRFLHAWAGLEGRILSLARLRRARVYSFREAADALAGDGLLSGEQRRQLDELRRTRNTVVREPRRLKPGQLGDAADALRALSQGLPRS